MLKMIISDFDGTLFPKGDSKLRDDFIVKIKRLTDCGVVFAVNSGRPYYTLRQMLKPLENRTVFICNDGAQIMYKNCLLLKKTVSTEQVVPLVTAAVQRGLTPFAALRQRTLPVTDEILSKKGLFGEDIYKLVFVKNRADIKKIEYCKSVAAENSLRCSYEDGTYIEFCHKDANKGNATAYIKDRFRISDGIASFGDGDNDIKMFEQCDEVYLMKNSKGIVYKGAKIIDDMQRFVVEEL